VPDDPAGGVSNDRGGIGVAEGPIELFPPGNSVPYFG
jgi:hypothetical protein